MSKFCLFFLTSILIINVTAQDTLTIMTDTLVTEVDTGEIIVIDTLSPRRSAWHSAVLPGWGQISNKSYWKAPIAAGGVGLGIYATLRTRNEYLPYKEAAIQRFDGDSTTIDKFPHLDNGSLIKENRVHKNYVNLAVIYTLYAYAMNILDARTEATVNLQPLEEHYPAKAAFYSALLPGLGQAYNRKYWKIPIVYAALGTAIYFVIDNSTTYTDLEIAYRTRTDDQPGSTETEYTKQIPEALTEELKTLRNDFRQYRDYAYIGTAAVYILNIIDAIVDAHLYNFNVDDDMSYKFYPGIDFDPFSRAVNPQFSLSIKF